MTRPDRTDAWLSAVIARHTRALRTTEFLKAVRALSARYVERRAEIVQRSPTDSAGKRAAFAAFFAPLHFLTARAIVTSLDIGAVDLERLVDLGCGTGVAGAAWTLAAPRPVSILGVDREGWALDEAEWSWRQLGLKGRTRRADLLAAVEEIAGSRGRQFARTGFVLGWSVNEIAARDRARLLASLLTIAGTGAPVLVIEPIARTAAPWWDEWAGAWARAGGRADEWKFEPALPAALASLSDAAGFRRESLGARTLWVHLDRPMRRG